MNYTNTLDFFLQSFNYVQKGLQIEVGNFQIGFPPKISVINS